MEAHFIKRFMVETKIADRLIISDKGYCHWLNNLDRKSPKYIYFASAYVGKVLQIAPAEMENLYSGCRTEAGLARLGKFIEPYEVLCSDKNCATCEAITLKFVKKHRKSNCMSSHAPY